MNIEAILQKTDLFELVRMAGGEPDRNGRCACPIHGGKDKNNFHVYTDAGNKDGSVLATIAEVVMLWILCKNGADGI